MNVVSVSVEENTKEPLWIAKVEPFLLSVLERLSLSGKELSVLFCSNDFIATLNNQYRNIQSATDVLSFENGDSYIDENENTVQCLGDIVISIEMLAQNALSFNTDVDTELKRLLIHGVLHLCGYDHGSEHLEIGVEPTSEMLLLQEKILLEFADEKIIEQ